MFCLSHCCVLYGTWCHTETPYCSTQWKYCQISNVSCTLIGNKIVHHSDEVGAAPVAAAPTTSSFSMQHLASIDLGNNNCKTRQEIFKFWGFGASYIRRNSKMLKTHFGIKQNHHSNITWVSWHLKSLATWLFVQQHFQIARNIRLTSGSLHKGPEMQKVYPCHGFIRTVKHTAHTIVSWCHYAWCFLVIPGIWSEERTRCTHTAEDAYIHYGIKQAAFCVCGAEPVLPAGSQNTGSCAKPRTSWPQNPAPTSCKCKHRHFFAFITECLGLEKYMIFVSRKPKNLHVHSVSTNIFCFDYLAWFRDIYMIFKSRKRKRNTISL